MSTLSISGKELKCEEVVELLQKMGINCDISKNITITDGSIETGCRILTESTKQKDIHYLWDKCQNSFDLKCAHLHIPAVYAGCVWGFIKKKECPSSQSLLSKFPFPDLGWGKK